MAFSAARDSFGAEILSELNRFHTDSLEWLEAVFRAGREDGTITAVTRPQTEAMATMALVEGVQLMARAAENPTQFDGAVAKLESRLKRKFT